jgi:uncharacterized protein (DUF58 family)
MTMIVPRLSLVILAAVTVIPLFGMAVSEPRMAVPAAIFVLILAAVAAADARLGLRQLALLRVQLPKSLRWIAGRAARFEINLESTAARAVSVRFGFGYPPELIPPQEETTIQLPAQAGNHFAPCDCLPTQRGLFRIEGCFYEIPSPLRFWDVRAKNPQPIEVRAYPNLESERRHVASLFLRTNRAGTRAVRQVGQGRDFEKLREYVPGDGFDTIHWKATARRGHPITKVFQLERTQEVYVILDASRLSGRLQVPGDPAQGTHLDRYIAAALVLGLAAEKQGDLFGLLTFSDRVGGFVRARDGKAHYGACREALYRLEPRGVSPDFEEVISFIRLRLRRRALLIFMTDLDDPVLMESFQKSIDLICGQHLVLVQMLRTEKARPVFTNPEVGAVDDLYRDLASHLTWRDLRQLTVALQQQGVTLSMPTLDEFSADTIAGYLRVKHRQLL